MKRYLFYFLFLVVSSHSFGFNQSLTIQEKTNAADLIFYGTVINVTYKHSEDVVVSGETYPGLPHTFVTYSIEEIIKGQFNDRMITLRFMGGLQNANTQSYMQVVGQPMFDKGDQDILFVKNNTSYACPLVACADSRYRAIGDESLIYTDTGSEVLQGNNRNVVIGQQIDLEPVMVNHIGGTITLRRHRSKITGESTEIASAVNAENQFNINNFTDYLANLVLDSTSRETMESPVISANMSKPFTIAPLQASSPTSPRETIEIDPTSLTPTDRLEAKLVHQSGNPVLPEVALNRLNQLKTQ